MTIHFPSILSASPTVTWMIPVLNGMPYLTQTLASIDRQTFRDFQVILWDNGSTDGTVEEARRWIPERLAGKVVADRPLPLGAARAAMVSEVETDWCALVDSDDVNKPDRLEKQMRFLREHPEIDVLGSQINQLNSAGENLGLYSHYPLEHEQIVESMLVNNPIAQPAVIFRRSAILAAGNFHDVKVEDYDLWLRVAAEGFRFANLPEALVDYRVHPASTTQKQVAANLIQQYTLGHLMKTGPKLFGVDSETLAKLWDRQHPRAIAPLRKIADKLTRSGTHPWKSKTFYDTARQMICDRDVRSRIAAAVEHRGLAGGFAEIGAVGMQTLRAIARRLRVSTKRM